MVIDTLSNAKIYYPLHPLMEHAFAYITAHMEKLEPGTHRIDGEKLYIMVSEGDLRPKEAVFLEAHNKYIDIQVCLEGGETFGWRPRKRCFTPQGNFNTERDIQFFDDVPNNYFSVNAREFVIFFPEDAHAPLIGTGKNKKAVLKVLL